MKEEFLVTSDKLLTISQNGETARLDLTKIQPKGHRRLSARLKRQKYLLVCDITSKVFGGGLRPPHGEF